MGFEMRDSIGGTWSRIAAENRVTELEVELHRVKQERDFERARADGHAKLADSADGVIRGVLDAFGVGYDRDPILEAKKVVERLREMQTSVAFTGTIAEPPEPVVTGIAPAVGETLHLGQPSVVGPPARTDDEKLDAALKHMAEHPDIPVVMPTRHHDIEEAAQRAAECPIDIPEVTARRGGVTFSAGWRMPSDTVYNFLGDIKITKKDLRRMLKARDKTIRRQEKRVRNLERDIAGLNRVITRLGRDG